MCLMVFRWQPMANYPLILVANRDEWFARPTAVAHWWEDSPAIYAGRDLHAGGTWLGVRRNGQWAGLTNFRAPVHHRVGVLSRGVLVQNFLSQAVTPMMYAQGLAVEGMNGFNLLLGCLRRRELVYRSHLGVAQPLSAGLYGLSNAVLDTPWWKVTQAKARLAQVCTASLTAEKLWAVLDNTQQAPVITWPVTGVGDVWEARLSAMRIVAPEQAYGTRTTTALWCDESGWVQIAERTWTLTGEVAQEVHSRWQLADDAG